MPNKSMLISEVSKIKLFKELAVNNTRKVKLTHHAVDDYHFSVDSKAKFANIPLQYFWFAKLISMKLV